MIHSYVWHDSLQYVTWIIPEACTAARRNESRHTQRDMSHIWMSDVTYMNETNHTYEWVMSHVWMGRVSCHSISCIHEWVTLHIWMSHATRMNELNDTCEWVKSHLWMSQIIHMNESCHTFEWVVCRSTVTAGYMYCSAQLVWLCPSRRYIHRHYIKRALHHIKRALHHVKRAPHSIKRYRHSIQAAARMALSVSQVYMYIDKYIYIYIYLYIYKCMYNTYMYVCVYMYI